MCLRAGLLIGWDDQAKRALVTRANCDSWNCAECSVRMSSRWALRAQIGAQDLFSRGERVDFVTITGHEKLKTFAATERVWRDAWSALYAALKRKAPSKFEYMIVPEKHKNGRMHVHVIWNADVSQKWLKDACRTRGLGHQAKIMRGLPEHIIVAYICKYIGKHLGEEVPKHFRRVRVSRGWADIPTPNTEISDLRWEYIGTNGALKTVYLECAAKHIALIDLETGEYFDDVDLGTIAI